MKIIDILIIFMMLFLVGASVYFNFIFPKKIEREKSERIEKEKPKKSL